MFPVFFIFFLQKCSQKTSWKSTWKKKIWMSKGWSLFLFQVITYKCDVGIKKEVGRKEFSVFFPRVEKKTGRKQKARWSWVFLYILTSLFNFVLSLADVTLSPRFFPSEEKKTEKSHSGEVGRRSYIITRKRKNDPPLGQLISVIRYWHFSAKKSHVLTRN